MNTPDFWYRPPGLLSTALMPLTLAWRAGTAWRQARATPVKAPVPVLCVGNLTAGGAGKSPMVAALAQRLAGQGITAHIVSRGHGGRIEGPHRVDIRTDTHADVGDEPLMLAATTPVWVARDRAAGAIAAAKAGADIVILDDGFQNPGLVKDASILMVDAANGFGNGRLIPAGPLREPLAAGLARADLTVLVGPAETRATAVDRWPALAAARVIGAELVPVQTGMVMEDDPVFAFAGIGHPEKFFATLRHMGARLVGTRAFPDHHPYSSAIIRRLIADAHARNAMLVTTEKDAVRLPPAHRSDVMTVQVRLEPQDWAPIDDLVRSIKAKES